MARTDNDIIDVNLVLSGNISLDKERIETDPIWQTICFANGCDPENDFSIDLLAEYLKHYIIREKLLTDCSSTNGPGNMSLQEMEIKWQPQL